MARIDLTGKRFGRFVALSYEGRHLWLCQCDCGLKVKVAGRFLREGEKKSCGCLNRERANSYRERIARPEYRIWFKMKYRCSSKADPAYRDYGGRGISVCARWLKSFENFFADIGPRPTVGHSLGRIDNDGNYEPGNVRWETRHQQSRNKRSTVWADWSGKKWVLTDLARHIGIDPRRLNFRNKRYGSTNEAVARSTGNY